MAAALAALQLVCGALATRAGDTPTDLALINRPAAILQAAAPSLRDVVWVFVITDLW